MLACLANCCTSVISLPAKRLSVTAVWRRLCAVSLALSYPAPLSLCFATPLMERVLSLWPLLLLEREAKSGSTPSLAPLALK